MKAACLKWSGIKKKHSAWAKRKRRRRNRGCEGGGGFNRGKARWLTGCIARVGWGRLSEVRWNIPWAKLDWKHHGQNNLRTGRTHVSLRRNTEALLLSLSLKSKHLLLLATSDRDAYTHVRIFNTRDCLTQWLAFLNSNIAKCHYILPNRITNAGEHLHCGSEADKLVGRVKYFVRNSVKYSVRYL